MGNKVDRLLTITQGFARFDCGLLDCELIVAQTIESNARIVLIAFASDAEIRGNYDFTRRFFGGLANGLNVCKVATKRDLCWLEATLLIVFINGLCKQ
jgi:hypothetical protein